MALLLLPACGSRNVEPGPGKEAIKSAADLLFQTEHYKQVFPLYLELAQSRDKFAQYRLSFMYRYGLGVEQDMIEAYAWATLAAELQHVYMLGYLDEIRAELDPAIADEAQKRALYYFRAHSVFRRGTFYVPERCTFIDRIRQAHEQHDRVTTRDKSQFGPRTGCRAIVNVDKAFREKKYEFVFPMFLKKARKGDKYSQYRVSEMYSKGLGVEQNLVEAYAWGVLATEFGVPVFNYHVDQVANRLSADEMQLAMRKSGEYFKQYSSIALAQNSLENARASKFSCTGSRVGNTCDRPGVRGAFTTANNNIFLGVAADISDNQTDEQVAKSWADLRKDMTALRDYIRTYLATRGIVTLGEFQIIDEQLGREARDGG